MICKKLKEYCPLSISYKNAVATLALLILLIHTAYSKTPRADLLSQARKDVETLDSFMGDWAGLSVSNDQTKTLIVAQIIALGNGKYQANLLSGFNQRVEPIAILEGQAKNGEKTIYLKGPDAEGTVKNSEFVGRLGNEQSFSMKRIYRVSPTLGANPPAGAIVLFDGKNYDNFKSVKTNHIPWKLVNSFMQVEPKTGSIVTKQQFEDFKLHLEFRPPFKPEARGQDRGNSGVYIHGRYEIQILDSYGLQGLANECGGIYERWDEKRSPHGFEGKTPLVNAALPPGQWQSYDIIFTAPRFNKSGKKIIDACFKKVVHNGIIIHQDVELSGPTRAGLFSDEEPTGPVMLQGHGNKVQFRNIWLVELP